MKIEILVLQRGWVIVGPVERSGSMVTVRGGAVVRRWGTTEGLGQLAELGPGTRRCSTASTAL